MTPKSLDSSTSAGSSFVPHVCPNDDTALPQRSGGNVHGPSASTEDVSGPAHLKSASPKPASTAASSTYTARSSCSSVGSISEPLAPSVPSLPPKVGTRFSKESARILRHWLESHKHHPFPSRDDNDMLQRFTGLSNVQIKTWFANARRRRKLQESPSRPTKTSPCGGTVMPERPGTPLPAFGRNAKDVQDMDPLERWFDSPPEDEPASARDIARAMDSGSQSFLRKGRISSRTLGQMHQHPSTKPTIRALEPLWRPRLRR